MKMSTNRIIVAGATLAPGIGAIADTKSKNENGWWKGQGDKNYPIARTISIAMTASEPWDGETANEHSANGLNAWVDHLADIGIPIVSINTAYDNGWGWTTDDHNFDPGCLWAGLDLSNPFWWNSVFHDPDATANDDGTGKRNKAWDKFRRKTIQNGQKLLTWINPSYFWTGSPFFDGTNGLSGDEAKFGDADNMWNWWSWDTDASHRGTYPQGWDIDDRPDDNNPTCSSGDIGYIYDKNTDASYISTWGHQPSANFGPGSPWVEGTGLNLIKMFDWWINDQGVDGHYGIDAVIFDDPTRYVNAGYMRDSGYGPLWDEPAENRLKDALTSFVASFGAVAQFAEVYPELWDNDDLNLKKEDFRRKNEAFGFDGLLSSHDGVRNDPAYGWRAIHDAITLENPNVLEHLGNGDNGDESFFYFSDKRRSEGMVPWMRQPTFFTWDGDLDANMFSQSSNCPDDGTPFTCNDCNCEGGNFWNCSEMPGAENIGTMTIDDCLDACRNKGDDCYAITVGGVSKYFKTPDQGAGPVTELQCYLLPQWPSFDTCGGSPYAPDAKGNITPPADSQGNPDYTFATYEKFADKKNLLSMAIAGTAGVMLAIEEDGQGSWWQAAPWPAETRLKNLVNGLQQLPIFYDVDNNTNRRETVMDGYYAQNENGDDVTNNIFVQRRFYGDAYGWPDDNADFAMLVANMHPGDVIVDFSDHLGGALEKTDYCPNGPNDCIYDLQHDCMLPFVNDGSGKYKIALEEYGFHIIQIGGGRSGNTCN